MTMNETERIDNLKRELKRCKEAPWNSVSLLVAISGAGAICYYFFSDDSDLSFLIGGIMGLTISLLVWSKLRLVYKELSKVYEAELDKAGKNR